MSVHETPNSGRILAVVLILLTALVLLAPRTAPRSAQVYPSGPGTTATTTPGQTGAPSSWATLPTPVPSAAAVSFGPGTAAPSQALGDATQARNPKLTPPPEGISGTATWYSAPYGTAAAAFALRAYLGPTWRGTRVQVSIPGVPPIVVVLTDWEASAIPGRLVDLNAAQFAALAPLSRGVLRVTVEAQP